MRQFSLLTIWSVILLSLIASAQDNNKYELDDIIVTASRTPVAFSDLTRSVVVIHPDEINDTPVNSIQDLLQYVSGIDIKQRGVEGVQADAEIRGGSFEQTLILIDGIKLSDPQTAHHNFNLPVSLDNVERIEVLKGQGSSIYGPNAFSGIINIITKKGRENLLSLQATGGENGYHEEVLSGSFLLGSLGNQVSVSKKKSDGYRHNTDFDIINFSYGSSFESQLGSLNLFFGYNDKEFGANSFYSTAFPNQWEHTTTKLLSAGFKTGNENLSISSSGYWRRNDDEFLLNYENPSFYRNTHKTNVYGFEFQSSLNTSFGTTSFGGEYSKDKIESSNLGNHSREKYGIFAEHLFSPVENLTAIVDAFAYDYARIGWRLWPGLDLAYRVAPNIKLFGSVGKAFRIPSYTELYYSDPVTQGDAGLQHEETINYEIGTTITQSFYFVTVSLFRKEGKNLIDWVRTSDDEKWMVMNIAEVNTNGIDVEISFMPKMIIPGFPVSNLGINYTYLNSDKSTFEFRSRYVLDYLKHQLIVNVSNELFFNIKQSWAFRYEDRVNLESNFIVDTKLLYNFKQFEIFIKASNLFNKSYKDITGLPLPGRWITGGVKFSIR